MYEQQLDNFVKLSIKEATSIQADPMNWQDHAHKANAYAAVAKLLMDYSPKASLPQQTEEAPEEIPQTKEALKAAPAPQLEEPEPETVQEVVEEELKEETPPSTEEEELMNELSKGISAWLDNEGCPTQEHINYWTSQIVGEEVSDFSEINNYPEYTQAWIDYIRCWLYLTDCWNLEDIPKVLELITEGQLNKLEDITPSNIGALVAYTQQQMEEAEQQENQ